MTVYARNRRMMWTAFSHAGRDVLNIADTSTPGRVASILIPVEHVGTFISDGDREANSLADELLRTGIRLAQAISTPPVDADARLAA